MSTDKAGCAIDQVQHCTSMQDVRRNVDALDDVLVPLLVTRMGYMQQAARIKADVAQVRDEDRIGPSCAACASARPPRAASPT
jgi:isochorismate pyruvate lyase